MKSEREIVEAAMNWKRAMLHRMRVYAETRLLEGVEYQMPPNDPDVMSRIDARAYVRATEQRLMSAIGDVDGEYGTADA